MQIDINATRLGRRPLELGVLGAGETIRAVLPKLTRKNDRRFLHDLLRRHEWALSRVMDAYTHDVARHTPIHPEYVADRIDDLAADDAIFTSDTGMCNVWTARYITPNGRRRILGSFKHGSTANALPHAIGAQLAAPRRQVIAMAGAITDPPAMGRVTSTVTRWMACCLIAIGPDVARRGAREVWGCGGSPRLGQ